MASIARTGGQRRLTLALCAVLHAFTHLYPTLLPPLYVTMTRDLGLREVSLAALLVTVQAFAYCAAAIPAGLLADHASRKYALAAGLALNAAAFIGLARAPSYGWALFFILVAGLAGGFYHPAANALIAGLFPGRQGKAIGMAGMGAAVGFFLGPAYGGWRGQAAGWRAPCLEMGLAGLAVALLFAVLASDAPKRDLPAEGKGAGGAAGGARRRAMLAWLAVMSLAFGVRDFAASGFVTLTALFLPQAHHFDAGLTGRYLGLMSLVALAANPAIGSVSDGPRRLWWAGAVLSIAAAAAAIFPWVPAAALLPVLFVYGFFQLASYPVVEAAVCEAIPDRLRGRAFALMLTGGGLLSSSAPWVLARLKDSSVGSTPAAGAFGPLYVALGSLYIVSVLAGVPALRQVRGFKIPD